MKIVANKLGKRFIRDWIFRDFSHEFVKGKTYAITGPNGSGKSTLLQILWGQMPPSEGSVSYQGKNGPLRMDEIFKTISIATPYMDLIDEFTLEEMVDFHFKFKSMRTPGTTNDVIEKMELQHVRKKLVSNFSSGMRQRLKLGLAFFAQSEVLFLDEPTTNLDKSAIDWYWKNILPLLDQTITVLASNQEAEYPTNSEKINILTNK